MQIPDQILSPATRGERKKKCITPLTPATATKDLQLVDFSERKSDPKTEQ